MHRRLPCASQKTKVLYRSVPLTDEWKIKREIRRGEVPHEPAKSPYSILLCLFCEVVSPLRSRRPSQCKYAARCSVNNFARLEEGRVRLKHLRLSRLLPRHRRQIFFCEKALCVLAAAYAHTGSRIFKLSGPRFDKNVNDERLVQERAVSVTSSLAAVLCCHCMSFGGGVRS